MLITNAAQKVILNVMKNKGLDVEKIFLEIDVQREGNFKGNLGIAFNKEKTGHVIKQNGFQVTVGYGLSHENIIIDYAEIDGRKGLIFSEATG